MLSALKYEYCWCNFGAGVTFSVILDSDSEILDKYRPVCYRSGVRRKD